MITIQLGFSPINSGISISVHLIAAIFKNSLIMIAKYCNRFFTFY